MTDVRYSKSGFLYMVVGALAVAAAGMGYYIYDQSSNKADVEIKIDVPKIGSDS